MSDFNPNESIVVYCMVAKWKKISQFWLYEQYYWNNQSNFIQSAHIEMFNLCNI